jgi:transcriptional regulator with XRE-family HTH domain
MNQPSTGPKPYEQLGDKLKYFRQTKRESLEEVSSAVEVERHLLERFEAGVERPDENILELLINHYKLKETLADQLWELAGYNPEAFGEEAAIEEAVNVARQLIMVLSADNRTIYTDGVSIDCNKSGLQMTFSQTVAQGKPINVSRLGMSYQQAEEVLRALGVALTYARFSQSRSLLPPGK